MGGLLTVAYIVICADGVTETWSLLTQFVVLKEFNSIKYTECINFQGQLKKIYKKLEI